jgi:NAD(P)-dependent dehydrogenase (short-subunit alcohol dehydrogenase family)
MSGIMRRIVRRGEPGYKGIIWPRLVLAQRATNLPAYALSKPALSGLTIKPATELPGTGILVNAVCPGTTANPGMEAIPGAPRAPGGGQHCLGSAPPR